jgi:SAM-dependent methyltransferase
MCHKCEGRHPLLHYAADLKVFEGIPRLDSRFAGLSLDVDALEFVASCFASQIFHVNAGTFNLMQRRRNEEGMTQTSLMALYDVHNMHILSRESLIRLLDFKHGNTDTIISRDQCTCSPNLKAPSQKMKSSYLEELSQQQGNRSIRLLDVGTGNGRILEHLAPLFDEVVATERNSEMADCVRKRGLTCLHANDLSTCLPLGYKEYHDPDLDGPPPHGEQKRIENSIFDVVFLFNVIDRCDRPITLLQQIMRRLRSPASRLVLATPIPFHPIVEAGSAWVEASEPLLGVFNPCGCPTCANATGSHGGGGFGWEKGVELLDRVFVALGLKVEAFARCPYISQGDDSCAHYVLDDAVFVLSFPNAGSASAAELSVSGFYAAYAKAREVMTSARAPSVRCEGCSDVFPQLVYSTYKFTLTACTELY